MSTNIEDTSKFSTILFLLSIINTEDYANMNPNARANPLVRVKSAQDILDSEAEQILKQTDESGALNLAYESALCGHIRKAWERNKLHKIKMNQRLLKCLRARRGVYSQAELATLQEIGGLNIIYSDLSETKCRAGSAWIREVVMPVGERVFAFESTPLPDLPQEVKRALVEKAATQARQTMTQLFQQTQGVLSHEQFKQMSVDIGIEMRDDLTKEYKKRADACAKRMEERIADHMAEGGWDCAIDEFVEDFVTYPAAILKGPVYKRKKQLDWLPGFIPGVTNEPIMSWARVSPFDAYPAPHASDCQSGDFIERVRYRPNELYDCIGADDYREDQIREALKHFRKGHLEGWIWTDAERKRLEEETLFAFLSPSGVIDGIHYWGSVQGWMLLSWGVKGMPDMDLEKEYEIDAILIGPYVIRCAINKDPLHGRPYFNASYDQIPGAFWGRSVPDLAEVSQKMCNATACAMADNLSIASGPMGWCHADRLADGEDANNLGPWRMFYLKSDPTQGVNPGIGFFQPQSNADQLLKVYEQWEIKADDATGIPRYTYGNERVGGATDTATGLSMLMNNAAKGLRRAIASIDLRVIGPSLYQAFINEMIYGKDQDAKGDCVIVPRGAAAILIKESAMIHRQNGLQLVSGNPVLSQIVGTKGMSNLLRETLKAMEVPVDGIVPTEKEMEQKEAQQQQMQQAQMQAQQQAVQAQQAEAQQAGQTQERIKGAELAKDIEVAKINHGVVGGPPPQPDQPPAGPPPQFSPPLSQAALPPGQMAKQPQ